MDHLDHRLANRKSECRQPPNTHQCHDCHRHRQHRLPADYGTWLNGGRLRTAERQFFIVEFVFLEFVIIKLERWHGNLRSHDTVVLLGTLLREQQCVGGCALLHSGLHR
jgi:hypothetical protein